MNALTAVTVLIASISGLSGLSQVVARRRNNKSEASQTEASTDHQRVVTDLLLADNASDRLQKAVDTIEKMADTLTDTRAQVSSLWDEAEKSRRRSADCEAREQAQAARITALENARKPPPGAFPMSTFPLRNLNRVENAEGNHVVIYVDDADGSTALGWIRVPVSEVPSPEHLTVPLTEEPS